MKYKKKYWCMGQTNPPKGFCSLCHFWVDGKCMIVRVELPLRAQDIISILLIFTQVIKLKMDFYKSN